MLKRTKEAIKIGAISLGLLLVLEVGVRLLAPHNVETQWLNGRPLAVEDSILGHRLVPGAVALQKSPEFEARYVVNRRGLRGQPDEAVPARPGALRVLLLGDSFTFGIGGAYEEIWPTRFEQELLALGHDVQVLNAGVPGYDTRSEVRYLQRLIGPFEPDVVVLGFLPNDLFTNRPMGERGALSSEPVIVHRGEKDPPLHVVALLQRLLLQKDWIYVEVYRRSGRAGLFHVPFSQAVREQFDVTEQLLDQAASLCQARDVPLVVLSLPQQFQVLAAHSDGPGTIDVHAVDQRLSQWAAEAGVYWMATLDTLAQAYQERGDVFYRYDGHLTARGNRVVGTYAARRFADWLRASR